jgi:hypothetical protein
MTPARMREMVDHVRVAWQVSIRRTCRAVTATGRRTTTVRSGLGRGCVT